MYTPHSQADIEAMLDVVGAARLEELVKVPAEVALRESVRVPGPLPETEIARKFSALAARNAAQEMPSFLGAGAYRHYVPPVIGALSMRGEFLTSYTPYQAEVSQGYLQAIYEWQTYICLLTGLDVANASVYDGATALAEAAIMAVNATGRRALLVSRAVHPNYRAVLKTYADGIDVEVDEQPFTGTGTTDDGDLLSLVRDGRYAAVIRQSPNFFGALDAPPTDSVATIKDSGTLLIGVVVEPLSLALLATPASWGCDICAGEAQSFGNAQAYGGPHVGFIACTQEHLRRIPGRLVGRTLDASGRTAYVLTLQAREQHIRREKASSNICTNQAHCALTATIYLAALGATGLRDCALENLERARRTAESVCAIPGVTRRFDAPVFNEFAVRVPGRAAEVLEELQARGVLGGLDLGRFYPELDDAILMTATEMTADAEIEALSAGLRALVPALRERSAHLAATR
ncbi:MAG: aminomethyl-transferring glycine dehydrogenase subunit GcvPA [Candidatus Eremiobacteraeota bacterium]|nr:aminomethyl-transferring glycine dehydrogenase subunit GcvPA [Candidatus Eremiobacteraeota bacterium]